ncbi:MAG TPA: tetratricopeptide repeat protein [Thermoanaerobaculia bacterium]|jgi:tetratricopeptide (TPR) repeat protein/predicted Ser/Thr protein kinase|nr:tetratricopeptide repeat protein [Thermoanaerobaculia bacterium]
MAYARLPRPDEEPTLRIVHSAGSSRDLARDPDGWLEPGERLAGRYRIQERIGSGGMGVVYRATDEQLGLCVALKALRPHVTDNGRMQERLRRELLLARQVSHRNAVRIHDIGQDGGVLFLTMDLVEGRSLRDVLREEQTLSPDRAVSIARQLALALEAAHEEGIVHRDIKPANVLVDSTGRAWITDFGVARSLRDPGITRTGAVVGTLSYLSPEQARGGEVDARSDLYALGILMFEMLTGELPFRGGSEAEAMAQRITGATRDVQTLREDVPPWLALVVQKLLQRDPGRRFQSASELIQALEGKRSFRWLPLRRTAAAVLALPALMAAGWFAYPHQPSPAAPRAPQEPPALAASPALPGSAFPKAQRAYERGLQLVARRDERAAVAELRQAVAVDPAFTAAWIQLSRTLSGMGQQREALEAAHHASATPDAGREAWALDARLRGKPERARKLLEEILAGRPNDTELRVELAEVCTEAGDLDAAIGHLRRVVAAAPGHPRAWFLLGKAAILAGDSRRAADDYLVHALVVQNRLRSEAGRAEALNAFGIAYQDLGLPDRAVESYEEAAEIRRRIGDDRGQAATLRNLGRVALSQGEHDRAEARLDEALALLEKLDDPVGTAELHHDLGLLAEERGRYPDALEHYRHALQIRRPLGRPLDVADSLRSVGWASSLLGRYDDAMVYWSQGLELARRSGDQAGITLGRQDIGTLQIIQGDWDAARASFQQSLKESRELQMPEATGAALGHLGRVAQLQGRFQEALSSFAEAQAVLKELGDVRGQAEFALAEAETRMEMGDPDAAARNLDAAEARLAEGGNREQKAELLRLRAELSRLRGETIAARRFAGQAVTEAEASGAVAVLLDARVTRAQLAGRKGLADLRELSAEAGQLGNRVLQLRTAEALASAALESGDLREAEAAARSGLEAAEDSGTWAGTARLRQLLDGALGRQQVSSLR